MGERAERLNLARDILLGIALAGGVLVLVAIAPGLTAVLRPFMGRYRSRSIETAAVKQKLRRLERKGLVAMSEQDGKTKLYLTKAGKQKVLEYRSDEMQIPRQDPWDGLYRFVMFDIPERKKLAREVFRSKLVQLGFQKIQHSVWRHRYPCQPEIEFLTNLYDIARYVDIVEGKKVS
jgi:DNA-binding transcriptional regulator PaaX